MIILILVLLFLILRSTYSKYVSEAKGDASAEIGKWIIKVNDTDITEQDPNNFKAPIRFEINGKDVNWEDSDPVNTRNNKVAPGMKGKMFIRIAPETDTSLKYEFELDATSLKDTNIVITDIKLNNGKKFDGDLTFEEIKGDGTDKYKFTRLSEIKDSEGNLISDENRIDTIVISIEWKKVEESNPEYDEYNARDTLLGNNAYTAADIKLPVTIRAIQYTGESHE